MYFVLYTTTKTTVSDVYIFNPKLSLQLLFLLPPPPPPLSLLCFTVNVDCAGNTERVNNRFMINDGYSLY